MYREFLAGYYHTVGLKSDGTVVAVGRYMDAQCEVSSWTDISRIAAGYYHTVGLKSDETVLAVGLNYDGQCNFGSWTLIVCLYEGDFDEDGDVDGSDLAAFAASFGRTDCP